MLQITLLALKRMQGFEATGSDVFLSRGSPKLAFPESWPFYVEPA